LSGAPISDLSPLTNCPNLSNLAIRIADETDVSPLTRLGQLRSFTITDSKFDGSQFKLLPHQLRWLGLINCEVDSEDLSFVSEFPSLDSLYLGGMPIKSLHGIEAATELQVFWMVDTPVCDLTPLTNLEKLWRVDLKSTNVSDLTPLTGRSKLVQVGLQNTKVRDLSPLASCTKLQEIDLTGTVVETLAPLKGLSSLSRLTLDDNQIDDAEVSVRK
jgi:Leucine-rich repeat (LRR) protein